MVQSSRTVSQHQYFQPQHTQPKSIF